MPSSAPAAHDVLAQKYIGLYPQEAAECLEDEPVSEAVALIADQTADDAAAILSQMEPDYASRCVADMQDESVRQVLPLLDVTYLSALLSRLSKEVRESRLALLPPGLASEANELMSYPPSTAGHVMDPRFFSFRPELTVKEVLERLHTLRQRRVRDLLLVDSDGQYIGAVPLPEVVMAEPDQRLESLVKGQEPSIQAMAPKEDIGEVQSGSRLSSLPVVDFNGKLVGTIRQSALMQAVAEEATAGIQTMVGVSKEERALSSPVMAVRKRLPWLNINLLTAFLAAAVVGLFENTIAQVTALAVLLPVVAGQSGNTGAQALAVTMRGLALREVRVSQWPKLIIKEGTAGAINGVAIAVVTMIGVFIWSQSLPLCGVIGVAMVMSMAIAAIAGTAIPVVLTVLKQDPAQSSSIVLTTVTDVIGFFSFLGLATLFASALVASS